MKTAFLNIATATLVSTVCLAAQPKQQMAQQFGRPALLRADFNRLAVHHDLPLFWRTDDNNNGAIEPAELIVTGFGAVQKQFVRGDEFTAAFEKAYAQLVEARRQESVKIELDTGRPSVVFTNFDNATPIEKAVVKELIAANTLIEQLYWRQSGAASLVKQLGKVDPASRSLFWRNHGPWCQSSATKGNPLCSALPSFPPKVTETYPTDVAQDDTLCKTLAAQPNAKELNDPYTVVRKKSGAWVALPLTAAYGAQMKQIAKHLSAAAKFLSKDPKEVAFVNYLNAAAQAFLTNQWDPADEAWVAMNATNSKWFLRIAPDEVYQDPCQQKGGFHLVLALIDPTSLKWQQALTPLRQEMETAIAKQIGAPYKARDVKFHMPDFIQIVLNGGDSRHAIGGTIGQSLPNWGKVPQEGRSRTVVMTNLYSDKDSRATSRKQAEYLLDKTSLAYFTDDPNAGLIDIILHEATHNFGPYSDYRLNGKTPKEIFGGPMASVMEELKAQTGALWFLKLLRQKNLLTDKQLKEAYTGGILWAFGHISRGMYTATGHPQTYSQLAAVQVGTFMRDGAITYTNNRFQIHYDKLAASVDRLMTTVGNIKARGDVAAARKLIDDHISADALKTIGATFIADQLKRLPKSTFRYAVHF